MAEKNEMTDRKKNYKKANNDKPIDKNKRSVNWCLTIYNFEDVENAIKSVGDDNKLRYFIYGNELCPTTGRLHFQSFLQCHEAQRFSFIKKILPTAWLRQSNGSAEQGRDYCTKDKNYKEFGHFIPTKGTRTDLIGVIDKLKEGKNLKEIIGDDNKMAMNISTLQKLQLLYAFDDQPRNHKMKIIVYWGVAGCGKTTEATKYSKNYYMLTPPTSSGKLWWDGYNNIIHDTVIIDEMDGSFMPLHDFKRLCDDHEYMVDCKGYRQQFKAKTIIFTSNNHPYKWYNFKSKNDEEAFKRRIDLIEYFEKKYDKLKPNIDNTPQHILDELFNDKKLFI